MVVVAAAPIAASGGWNAALAVLAAACVALVANVVALFILAALGAK